MGRRRDWGPRYVKQCSRGIHRPTACRSGCGPIDPLALLALDDPQSEAENALAAFEEILTTEDLPPEVYERALLVLASVIFTRPDLPT